MLSSYINFTIGQYIIEPKKTLKKWTRPNVNMEVLSNLEYAYVRNKIDKNILSKTNTIMAKFILKNNPDKLNWRFLLLNSSTWANKLFKMNIIDWLWLSDNPNKRASKILKTRRDKINWYWLSRNPSNWAIKILKNNPKETSYSWISGNPNKWAYKLLKNKKEHINWNALSRNPSQWVGKLIRKNPDKINWDLISLNSSKWAYKMLKKNKDKINWTTFSSNPYLFRIIKTNYKLFDDLIYKKN
jgi:hypothetical protein